MQKLLGIFASPVQPKLADYYEPWTYDYQTLIEAPLGDDFPVARPKSLITGENTKITWSANWDDNLGGSSEMGHLDPIVAKLNASVRRESEEKVRFELEKTFMFYLPRICEHCLNPSCMASCPSGAIYKREEDGIVLVDQDRCRGWRQCITGCPYKKIYFNHKSGKAEKCTFCYPRVEVGLPTVCSETCVGRLRYLGLFLYDADRVTAAAATPDEGDLYEAQLDLLLDPSDPAVIAAARRDGIPDDWMDAARRSPVYALAKTYRVALPLHPEYRTMPMVWYVPPLSPIVDVLSSQGHDAEDRGVLFGAIEALRIPVDYLAELFTAGRTDIITGVLQKLAAMRAYMRDVSLGRDGDPAIPAAVGMSEETLYEMYRLMAIAKYADRYVIPTAHVERAHELEEIGCSLDFDEGPGMYESGPFGEASGRPAPVAVETFNALKQRQTSDSAMTTTSGGELRGRVNLLNWDGNGAPDGLFPGGRPTSERGATDGGAAMIGLRRRAERRRDQHDHRVVHLVAARCLDYPREELVESLPTLLSALAEQGDSPGARELRPLVEHLGSRPLEDLQRAYVDTFDLSRKHALYLSYWTDGDTRRRGEVLGRFKTAYRRSGFLVDTHGELPDYLPMVLEFAACADADAGRGAAAGLPREPRAAADRLAGEGESVCRRRRRRVRHPPRAVARRPRGGHGDGRDEWPAPDRDRGARPLRPETPSAATGLVGWGRGGAAHEHLPLGRPALPLRREPRRRHDLALPLRQVRLDDPLVAALRVAPAAHRLAALPLRHPARLLRARRWPRHPRVVDRGGRRQRGALPLQRAALRRHRRRVHARRHPHPRLPPAHDRARSSWRRRRTTS